MTHSDDAGLVLPPAVAPTQVVLVPISPKGPALTLTLTLTLTQVVLVPISPKGPEKAPEQHAELMGFVDKAFFALKAAGVRAHVDTRFNMKPGAKFYE